MMYLFLVLFVVWKYFSKEKVDSLLPHCLQFPLTIAIDLLCEKICYSVNTQHCFRMNVLRGSLLVDLLA